jgi:hypothetical protein
VSDALDVALDRDLAAAVDAAAAMEATLAVTDAREKEDACRGRIFGRGTVASSEAWLVAINCCSALVPINPRRAVQLESTTPVKTLLAESAAEPAISVTWKTRPRRRDEAETILAASALLSSRYVRPIGDRSSTLSCQLLNLKEDQAYLITLSESSPNPRSTIATCSKNSTTAVKLTIA